MKNQRYDNLKARTKRFVLDVVMLVDSLCEGHSARVLGMQLLRAGSSVGANYRAACRAKSRADFISKMGTVEEEADESAFWIEVLVDSGKVARLAAEPLLQEANELTAIAVASILTARGPSVPPKR